MNAFDLVQNRLPAPAPVGISSRCPRNAGGSGSPRCQVDAVDLRRRQTDQEGLGSGRDRRHADLAGDPPIDRSRQTAERRRQRGDCRSRRRNGCRGPVPECRSTMQSACLSNSRQQEITELIGQQADGPPPETPWSSSSPSGSERLPSLRSPNGLAAGTREHFLPCIARLVAATVPAAHAASARRQAVADAAGDDPLSPALAPDQ